MEEHNKTEIRSDEITEILGIPPRWLIRWGITVVFIVLAIVFVGSAFFTYPDIVSAPVIITSENPPSSIVAKASGKPEAIFYQDGDLVKAGDTLAVIENAAKFPDIYRLSRFLSNFTIDSSTQNITINSLSDLELGDLQSLFSKFSKCLNDYQLFASQRLYDQKVRSLEEELKQSWILYDRIWSQRRLALEDLKLTEKQYTRDSQLLKAGAIAALDFEKSQAALIGKKQQFESIRLSLSNASISIERLKQSITDTKLEQERQKTNLQAELLNSLNQLKSGLASWEKSYLMIAPSNGKITYLTLWSKLQEVKAGDMVFSINPMDRGKVQARLLIPFDRAGKVKVGQKVNIKLDGYPYMEFGLVEGRVESISSGSVENGFPTVVNLVNGACSSYGIKLNTDRELTGIAEINTESLTVLQRLLNPFKHLFKDRFSPESDR